MLVTNQLGSGKLNIQSYCCRFQMLVARNKENSVMKLWLKYRCEKQYTVTTHVNKPSLSRENFQGFFRDKNFRIHQGASVTQKSLRKTSKETSSLILISKINLLNAKGNTKSLAFFLTKTLFFTRSSSTSTIFGGTTAMAKGIKNNKQTHEIFA